MRIDKARNTAKVLKEVLKKPLQTDRELEKELWIWKSSVNRAKQELGQIGTKSDIILEICDLDINLVKSWLKELQRRFNDEEEIKKIRPTEISQVIKDSSSRYTIFKWDITNKEWGLKNITEIDIL